MATQRESGPPQPTVGATVTTADGYELGTVKEVRPRAFKVDARLAPDYWLPLDCIRGAVPGFVRLTLMRDEVDAAKVTGQGHTLSGGAGGPPDSV
jgi:hypothetical protein